MRYACLFVPNFPLQAATRLAKENALPDGGKLPLSQSALAILDGKPPWVTVIAVNEKAWRAGVDVGMTKLQAESCPSVILRHRGLAQEKAAQAALLDCVHAISPRVEAPRPDLVLLDLHGLASLYTSEENVASTLTRLVAEIGLQANVGVASNLEAAMHAARGFTGITLIPAGQEGERLGQLPVALLSPSQEILETLDHWGIRCFRELAALPTKALAERLGQDGVRLQRLARGKEQRLLVPIGPALEFEESVELDEPLEMLEPLSFCLNAMLLQLCARLAARSLATDRLDLTLYLAAHEDLQLQHPGKQTAEICGPPSQPGNSRSLHRRTLRLPVPMRDSRKLLKLLQLDLSSHPPPAPVQQVVFPNRSVNSTNARARAVGSDAGSGSKRCGRLCAQLSTLACRKRSVAGFPSAGRLWYGAILSFCGNPSRHYSQPQPAFLSVAGVSSSPGD
ncbi:MAG: hypothetical protein DMG06_22460 [Acidobacteria bacterium]|nr:MAG: hypothetical protein DMG06_22460 [Acidobacteriota bacterium]